MRLIYLDKFRILFLFLFIYLFSQEEQWKVRDSIHVIVNLTLTVSYGTVYGKLLLYVIRTCVEVMPGHNVRAACRQEQTFNDVYTSKEDTVKRRARLTFQCAGPRPTTWRCAARLIFAVHRGLLTHVLVGTPAF